MSPRPADPALRERLVAAAARVLAEEGSAALSARRLARETGASTMAVYTHFGGMDQLRGAVRAAGLAQLAARMAGVPRTEDPVADLAGLGVAYVENALADPLVFRAAFMEAEFDPAALEAGAAVFQPLVDAVARCVDAGRFAPAEPWSIATQLWISTHGTATLHLAGLLTEEAAADALRAMGRALFTGFGDEPAAAAASVEAARAL